jgi:hypothetical protein
MFDLSGLFLAHGESENVHVIIAEGKGRDIHM